MPTIVVEDALDVTSNDAADRMTFITVTAADGSTQKIYSVEFHVPGDVATLSDLYFTLPSGRLTLSPAFSSEVTSYTCELDAGTSLTPDINWTRTDENAAIEVSEATDVTSANDADRTTTITVTAEDGTTQVIYRVVFNVTGDGTGGLRHAFIRVFPNPVTEHLTLTSDRVIHQCQHIQCPGQGGSDVHHRPVNRYHRYAFNGPWRIFYPGHHARR